MSDQAHQARIARAEKEARAAVEAAKAGGNGDRANVDGDTPHSNTPDGATSPPGGSLNPGARDVGSKDRPQVVQPGVGWTVSMFAEQLGEAIFPLTETLVQTVGDDQVCSIEMEEFDGKLDRFKLAKGGLKFKPMSPIRMANWIEQFVDIGTSRFVKTGTGKGWHFVSKTLAEVHAKGLLVNSVFLKRTPRVARLLDIPIPVRTANGEIVIPRPGLNKELGIYCNPSMPALRLVGLEEAWGILEKAFKGFCFKDEQARTHAWARLLTPFARGLMGYGERWPLWYFEGNRPRCGKDYLNGVTQIIYLGNVFEDLALTDDQKETQKRIVSALRSGRNMMHFANCQRDIDDVGVIQAVTLPVVGARSLGGNSAKNDLQLPNEIDYSISANTGLGYRADLSDRIRKISLEFFEEDANKRAFPNPRLHETIKKDRLEMIIGVLSVLGYWIRQGAPAGETLFSSFPRWAEVVGGIMKAGGKGEACLASAEDELLGGDKKEKAMKALYVAVYRVWGDRGIRKSDIYDVIIRTVADDPRLEWFGDLAGPTGEARSAQTRVGTALGSYRNRVSDGIRLEIDKSASNSGRWEYSWRKV